MGEIERAIEILNLINSAAPGIASLLLALKNANPEAPMKDILVQAGEEFHENMEEAERIIQRIMNSN